MMKFAKLFDSTKHGQILAKRDNHDEDGRPEVRLYFTMKGFGVCSVALLFVDLDDYDEDTANQAADDRFDAIDETQAVRIVEGAMEKFNG